MNASYIQGRICKFCKKNKIPYNNLIKMSESGWPDVMIVVNSLTYYFEVKFGRDKLSELQKYRIQQLNRDRKIAFVVKSYEDFAEIYKKLPKK